MTVTVRSCICVVKAATGGTLTGGGPLVIVNESVKFPPEVPMNCALS